tara:strand:- start:1896 stop:2519 length:624 start_codon:yes stop_codon:yes gene_type:complete
MSNQVFKGSIIDTYKFNDNKFSILDIPMTIKLVSRFDNGVPEFKSIDLEQPVVPSVKFAHDILNIMYKYLKGEHKYVQPCQAKRQDGTLYDSHQFTDAGWSHVQAMLAQGYSQVLDVDESTIADRFMSLNLTREIWDNNLCRKVIGRLSYLSKNFGSISDKTPYINEFAYRLVNVLNLTFNRVKTGNNPTPEQLKANNKQFDLFIQS